jgi:MFS family permease
VNPGAQSDGGFTGGGFRSHIILFVLCLVYVSDYADRYVVSSMLQFIKRDWGLTDAQGGSLMSVVLLFITIFTVPASILIDRWSRRKMVAIMVFIWSLATLSCAFTRSYVQLLAARAFIGIGEAGYAPGGTAMLSAAYPERHRAKVMGLWNMCIPLGVGLGLFAGEEIAKRWGWQHAFGLVALPGMLLAFAAWFLPDYKTVPTGESAAGFRNIKEFFTKAAGVMRIPSLVFTYLGFAMNVAITTALMHWLPSYFERTGIAEPGSGGKYTMPIFALVLVGAPLGGFLSDAWHKRRKEARLLFPAMTSAAAACVLLLGFLNIGSRAPVPILVGYGILATCFVAPGVSVTQDVIHPGLRAFSFAMCVIVQHLCGDIWSPWLLGLASDHIAATVGGGPSVGLSMAVIILPVFGLFAAVFFYLGSRFYNRDLDRVEKVELEPE